MKYAVVDSGPIIRGVRLERLGAEALVTIPEVLAEIRDKHARASLAQMPSELETREPSDEAIRTVSGFAKLTGDLPVLSSVDLRVLALTWMLQKETGGVAHLRTVPLAKVRTDDRAAALAAASGGAKAGAGSGKAEVVGSGTDPVLGTSQSAPAAAAAGAGGSGSERGVKPASQEGPRSWAALAASAPVAPVRDVAPVRQVAVSAPAPQHAGTPEGGDGGGGAPKLWSLLMGGI